MHTMKTVLFFQSTTRKSWLQKLSGVHRFAQERDWFVQVVERFATASDIRRALKTWAPIGCLVDRAMSTASAPDNVFRGIPTIYLDQNPERPSKEHPCLLHDSAASAALAVKDLLRCKCKSYAYIGTGKNMHWNKARLKRFKSDTAAAGQTLVTLALASLEEKLRDLPKPCGILGANDYCAMEAYNAATKMGLSVPDEVRIVGIDNDEAYCEAVKPGITSVEPDFEGAGWRMAQMLAEEIDNGTSVRTEYYGQLRIVRRGSTDTTPGVSARVRRAREFIRRHACEPGLSIDAIAAEMNCSRALATSRFRKETGRSILDEIHEIRLQKMRELLSSSTLPIAMVVERSGYESDGYAKRFFLKRTGMTMREYRRQSAKEGKREA
jgi:DNA-binding LacI/PurR family transcriptional regulator